MPLPALKIAILHYQPKGDEVDPVVTQLTEALSGLGHQVTTVAVDDYGSGSIDVLEMLRRATAGLRPAIGTSGAPMLRDALAH